MGTAVAAGADEDPVEGTAVGAAVVAPGAPGSDFAGIGVAVAEEPHANMAASQRAKVPRIINLGFLNQLFKMNRPPFGLGICQPILLRDCK